MDWSYLKFFTVAVLITASVYAVFPLLFALLRTSVITRKKYKTWCVCVTAAIALGLGVVSSLSGDGVSFAAALLWGTIFYNIGKSVLKKRELLIEEDMDHVKKNKASCMETEPKELVFSVETNFKVKPKETGTCKNGSSTKKFKVTPHNRINRTEPPTKEPGGAGLVLF